MDAEAVQRQINQTLQRTNNEMLSSFSQLLDSRLNAVQQNIRENQNIIAERQEAKIEHVLSDGYKFKKRGNEEQHKHNVKVMSKLKEASDELNEDKVTEAKQKIAEGLDIVKQRQKLIRLADSSEARWRAVDEYVKNPIASDSEDEKQIQKAQNRAERKFKEVKLKKRRDQRDNARPYARPSLTENTTTQTWKSGHCYRCNKRGHWRRDCTEKLDENKISRNVSELNHLIRNINVHRMNYHL